jgi:hypothetical protein
MPEVYLKQDADEDLYWADAAGTRITKVEIDEMKECEIKVTNSTGPTGDKVKLCFLNAQGGAVWSERTLARGPGKEYPVGGVKKVAARWWLINAGEQEVDLELEWYGSTKLQLTVPVLSNAGMGVMIVVLLVGIAIRFRCRAIRSSTV